MTKNNMVYQLDDGRITTVRSEFIRQEFNKGKSRGEIVKMLNDMGDKVTYQIVAIATINMDNGTIRNQGRRVYLEFEDGTKIPRKEYIVEQIVEKGRTMVDIAKELGISYHSVYMSVEDIDIKSKFINKDNKK